MSLYVALQHEVTPNVGDGRTRVPGGLDGAMPRRGRFTPRLLIEQAAG